MTTTVSQEAREAFANWEPMFSVWPVRDSAHSVAIAKAAFLAGFEARRQQAERGEVDLARNVLDAVTNWRENGADTFEVIDLLENIAKFALPTPPEAV